MWLRVSGRKVFLVGISVIIVGKWWTRTCLVELYPFCWFTIPVKLKNNAFCFFFQCCREMHMQRNLVLGFLCVFSMFSAHLPGFALGTLASSHSPKTCLWWKVNWQLEIGLRFECECELLFFLYVSLKSLRLIQGVLCLLPEGSWDRLQSLCDPTKG